MEQQYSIAIYPSEAILDLVKSMKLQLAQEVGWFHSKNSDAHITICEVKATDVTIEIIKKRLTAICDTLKPVEVRLNKFGSYPNGAFFIALDEDSKNNLKPIMKRVQDSLRGFDLQKSDDPHLSIARRLPPENLKKAIRLFRSIDVYFLCDSIVLRKFDENIKQFYVTDTFTFNSNPPPPELVQGTLF
jgi:2'-5' RNA ligase